MNAPSHNERVARVFPRRTRCTPEDDLAFVGRPPLWAAYDRVQISVAFSYDLATAEDLVADWRHVAPVEIGGPATGTPGDSFTPGLYVKPGYVITSRGCPNRCWFCQVWRREGDVRELPIMDGWNVLDDNLLACSRPHVEAVCAMLARQDRPAEFTGGLEAARLKPWHVDLFSRLKPAQMFFAFDTPNDEEPLFTAGKMLQEAGLATGHRLRCYVLVGYPSDSTAQATKRLQLTAKAGFFPMSMLYRNERGETDPQWRIFHTAWARPARIATMLRDGSKPFVRRRCDVTPGLNLA